MLGFTQERLGEKFSLSVGWKGCDIYSDTDTHTGAWKAFIVLAEATINAITDNGDDVSTIPTASAIPVGTFISANGNFTSIDLTSGTVIMYRA